MCGTVAISSQRANLPSEAVVEMTADLRHRGLHAHGAARTVAFQFGPWQLKVVDRMGGQEPIWDDSQRYCITFGGQIG